MRSPICGIYYRRGCRRWCECSSHGTLTLSYCTAVVLAGSWQARFQRNGSSEGGVWAGLHDLEERRYKCLLLPRPVG